MEIVILAVVIAVVVVGAIGGLVVGSRKKKRLPEAKAPSVPPTITAPPAEPHVGDEAETPRDEARRTLADVARPGGRAGGGAPRRGNPPGGGETKTWNTRGFIPPGEAGIVKAAGP
ncbi:hypothetical protein ACFWJH_37085, partial [Streptomyces lasiicapitis]